MTLETLSSLGLTVMRLGYVGYSGRSSELLIIARTVKSHVEFLIVAKLDRMFTNLPTSRLRHNIANVH